MNAPYRPQQHAAEVATGNELLHQALRALAAIQGDVARLVLALPRSDGPTDCGFESLLQGIFEAVGTTTWIVSDLDRRMLRSDQAGAALLTAVHAIGKTGNRKLGIYLAAQAPGESRVAGNGFELRRSGLAEGVQAWTVHKV